MKIAEIDMVKVAKMLSIFGWSVRRENGDWIFKPTK